MDKNFNRNPEIISQSYRTHFKNLQITIKILKQIRRNIYEELLDIDENDELLKDIDSLTRIIVLIKPRYYQVRTEYSYYQVCRDMKYMYGESKMQPNDKTNFNWLVREVEGTRYEVERQ